MPALHKIPFESCPKFLFIWKKEECPNSMEIRSALLDVVHLEAKI